MMVVTFVRCQNDRDALFGIQLLQRFLNALGNFGVIGDLYNLSIPFVVQLGLSLRAFAGVDALVHGDAI